MANSFNETVNALLKGMDGFMSTKTVVGEPMHVDGTIIIPLADVSFGIGAGAFEKDKSNNGGGGMGGKIQPAALLVIRDGVSKLVSIKEGNDGMGKILDLVPDIIGKLTSKKGKKGEKEEEKAELPAEAASEEVSE
ncbi:MAG: sporulation protein [Lachnospiraceae bacterium]|nr:sporulation protein [Lachnospiraceae bacterium]